MCETRSKDDVNVLLIGVWLFVFLITRFGK